MRKNGEIQSGVLNIRIEANDFDIGHVEALVRAFKWAWKETYSTPKIKSIKADYVERITKSTHQDWHWEGRDLKDLDKEMGGEPVEYKKRELPRMFE